MNIEQSAPRAQAPAEPAAQFAGINGNERNDRRAAALAALRAANKEPAQQAPAPRQEPAATQTDDDTPDERPTMLQAAEAEEHDEPEDRISAVVRAREKANRLRREAEAQRAEVERDRMRLDLERREVEQLRRAREAMQRDPIAGLKELGVDLRDLTERAAMDGTPEAQFRALQEQIAKQAKELEDYRTGQAQREMSQQRAAAEHQFFALAKDEEAFPYLAARAELHPELVKQQAYQLQDDYYKQTGKVPSLNDIAEALDYLASEEYRHVNERAARRGTSSPRTGTVSAAGKPKPSRTLSTSRAGEKSSAAPDTAHMSRDARRDYIVGMLKAGRLNG
jgi:hypothetical protein